MAQSEPVAAEQGQAIPGAAMKAVNWISAHRKLTIALVTGAMVLSAWFVVNPPGRFGWCAFGWTVYNSFPRPISDLQINGDGDLLKVDKTHDLTLDRVQWLMDSDAEVIIIATGWHGSCAPRKLLLDRASNSFHFLKTGEAIRLFNQLRKAGKRVAIHLHSTC